MLLIKSSKLSMLRSFSMSIMRTILMGLLLSLRHLLHYSKTKWSGFSLHSSVDNIYMSADGFHGTCCPIWRAYQKTLAGVDPQIYFGGFFQLTSTFCLSFVHLNFTITDSFFKRWQAWGIGFTSTDSHRWYRALVTGFLSSWTTLLVSNLLQFLVMAKSDETTSNLLKKSSNWFVKSEIFDIVSLMMTSSSITSSFERFSN